MLEPLATVRLAASGVVTTVKITGEVDSSNAAEVERQAREIADLGSRPGLIIDLSELRFLDSAGIHMLHRLDEQSTLVIVTPRGSFTERVISLAGLAEQLRLYDTTEQAVSAMRDWFGDEQSAQAVPGNGHHSEHSPGA